MAQSQWANLAHFRYWAFCNCFMCVVLLVWLHCVLSVPGLGDLFLVHVIAGVRKGKRRPGLGPLPNFSLTCSTVLFLILEYNFKTQSISKRNLKEREKERREEGRDRGRKETKQTIALQLLVFSQEHRRIMNLIINMTVYWTGILFLVFLKKIK